MQKVEKKILYVLILLALPTASAGEDEILWTHFDNSSDVRAIYQSGDSLWIGTNGGLHIYDLLTGEFVAKHLIGPYLPDNSIRAIGGQGDSVLVGTDEGLSVFTGEGVCTHESNRSPSFGDIRGIDIESAGTICISTYGHGVSVIRDDILYVYTRLDSLLDDRAFAAFQMDDSTIFFATALGLCAFRDSLWESFRVGFGLPRGEVRDLLITEDYAMYALIAGQGVFYFDGARGKRISPRNLFQDGDISAIGLDPDQTLWAAGTSGRIAYYRYGQWISVAASDEMVGKVRWQCIHASRGGTIYFGSAEGLIVSIKEGAVDKIQIPSTLPSNNVRAFVEDSTGYRYVAVGSCLLSVSGEGGAFSIENHMGPLLAMTVSPVGEVWFSTRWGLYRIVDGRPREVPLLLSGNVPVILSIAFDSSGNLWVGTNLGEVLRFDGLVWLRMGESDELTGGVIDRIILDGTGHIWALSRQRGISRFKGNRWENYLLESFDGKPLADVTVDPSGELIVAGFERIWRYEEGGAWQRLALVPPRADLEFTRIRFDRRGRIYLGTSRGLVLHEERSTRLLPPQEGIAGEEVNALMIDKGGLLWVGFRKDGLSMIPADQLW